MATPAPLIYVSHLPSASSFYASLIQPLNLRYLSATTTFPATLHFGQLTDAGKETLFSLTQSPIASPQPTNIYLPAPSPKSIEDFYNKSRLLNPGCRDTNIGDTEEGQGTRAITRDLDGNILEAMYSSRGARGAEPMETASTEHEARRILGWQREVAKSVSAEGDERSQVSAATEVIHRTPPTARRADSFPQPMRLLRRETVTEHYSPHGSLESAHVESGSGGISGKAIIGTILGAAAGAAVAYAMVRSESPPRRPAQLASAPQARARRASFAGPPPGYYAAALPPPVEMAPARSYVGSRVEESPPRYKEYSIRQAPPMARSHTYDMGRMIDERSYVSGPRSSGGSRFRSASEHRGSRFDRPLTILSREHSPGTQVSHRSHRSSAEKSYYTSASKSKQRSPTSDAHTMESRRSHHSSTSKYDTPRSHVSERDSYASARTRGTESTIKPSRTGTTTIIIGDDQSHHSSRDRGRSERGSYVSARDIALPRSVISVARDIPLPHSVVGGGSRYAASVAPSDSVSSVGMKRDRERLRDRMGSQRGGW